MQYETLSIPLEHTQATRHTRRVAPLYIAAAVGVMLGIVAFRLPFTLSTTLRIRPTDTVASIRILKTPDTIRAAEHVPLALRGFPWTLSDVLATSDREVTLHVLNDGQLGITIDHQVEVWQQSAAMFGYVVATDGSSTLLFPEDHDAEILGDQRRFASAAFLGTDAELITENASHRIKIGKDGIDILGMGFPSSSTSAFSLPDDAMVTAQLRIPAGVFVLPQHAETLKGTPTGDVLANLFTYGGSLTVSQDSQGTGYYVSLVPKSITVESLAAVGKDLANRRILSTRALTNAEGEVFTELYGDANALSIAIDAEDDYTYISISNNGETLRLARTPNLLTIANREIALTSGNKARSSCLLSAHSWATKNTLMSSDTLAMALPIAHVQLLFAYFGELSVNEHKTRLCW